MLEFHYTSQFKRDIKAQKKRGKDMRKFKQVHESLLEGTSLPIKVRDHALSNNWRGCRECHLEPDWLLIYRILPDENRLEYVRTGSHADLFS